MSLTKQIVSISALQGLAREHNSAQSPFAQIVCVPQSLVPGIWQNPLPLPRPGHSHTVDTKHESVKSVNRIV